MANKQSAEMSVEQINQIIEAVLKEHGRRDLYNLYTWTWNFCPLEELEGLGDIWAFGSILGIYSHNDVHDFVFLWCPPDTTLPKSQWLVARGNDEFDFYIVDASLADHLTRIISESASGDDAAVLEDLRARLAPMLAAHASYEQARSTARERWGGVFSSAVEDLISGEDWE